MCSCQKEQQPEVAEEISVSPAQIDATASLASYKIDVTSNVKWTVSVQGKDGADASWLTLGRTSGNGNMQLSVRVAANEYNTSRSASVIVATGGGKTAETLVVQQANEKGDDAPEGIILKVGTYNLRMSHLDNGTDNAWDIRKDRLKKSLMACEADFLGIQEVDDKTQAWLDSELASKYSFRYFSPYSKDGKGSRAQGIGFRFDKFTLSDWHYFWASDTPDVMTTNDTGSNGNFSRGGCCCILTHKATGMKIFVMNNHGCLNNQSNIDNAHVYVDMEKKYNTEGLVSFFVGDMNAKQSSTAGSVYMTYAAHWNDTYLKAAKRTGATGTYNSYSNPNGSSRIDYVFYRGEGVEPQLYHCDNTLYSGFYASDHFPVWGEFMIVK